MNDTICWLITLLNGGTLTEVAFKCKRDLLTEDCLAHPMEPENRNFIYNLLPRYIQIIGPIVDIKEIFEVCVREK